jgi:hypothetical protein
MAFYFLSPRSYPLLCGDPLCKGSQGVLPVRTRMKRLVRAFAMLSSAADTGRMFRTSKRMQVPSRSSNAAHSKRTCCRRAAVSVGRLAVRL